jgi:chromosome segregation ATPase
MGMKAQNFGMILNMIDQVVVILGKEQAEDDKQKEYCNSELDKAGDEKKAGEEKKAALDATISELSDGIASLKGEIDTLTGSIKELDKSVAAATEQRKEEHAEYTSSASLNEAALQLLGKAKNRLNKFYNPVLYKAPPKKVVSAEEDLITKSGFDAAALVQVRAHAHSHSRVVLPEAPADFAQLKTKGDKATGVLGLMDMMMGELKTDMKDAESNEKTAQKEYEALMQESSTSRAQTAKSITDKEASKAELEMKVSNARDSKALSVESLEDISVTINHLHTTCDFLMENYDARKEARTNEMESLKNGKAVLSGADFGF